MDEEVSIGPILHVRSSIDLPASVPDACSEYLISQEVFFVPKGGNRDRKRAALVFRTECGRVRERTQEREARWIEADVRAV